MNRTLERRAEFPWIVVLTVADHEQNGFVALARWQFADETLARAFIAAEDAAISEGAEPDHRDPDIAFTFILDLHDGRYNCVDSGRNLPTQAAMRLAPDQVREWLNMRPAPDDWLLQRTWGVLLPTPSTGGVHG